MRVRVKKIQKGKRMTADKMKTGKHSDEVVIHATTESECRRAEAMGWVLVYMRKTRSAGGSHTLFMLRKNRKATQ